MWKTETPPLWNLSERNNPVIKNGHKMARPFNMKKLTAYFKDEEVMVYETDKHLLMADRFFMFQVDLSEAITKGYKLEQKHKNYQMIGGELLEHSLMDLSKFWHRHVAVQDFCIVHPTNYFYQPDEYKLLRKFTDGKENTAWILKSLTDILGPMAIDLDYHFQFEQLYDSRDPKNKLPIRVSFRKELGDPLQVVAFFAGCMHREEWEMWH
jgi:hypothetical protein